MKKLSYCIHTVMGDLPTEQSRRGKTSTRNRTVITTGVEKVTQPCKIFTGLARVFKNHQTKQ